MTFRVQTLCQEYSRLFPDTVYNIAPCVIAYWSIGVINTKRLALLRSYELHAPLIVSVEMSTLQQYNKLHATSHIAHVLGE